MQTVEQMTDYILIRPVVGIQRCGFDIVLVSELIMSLILIITGIFTTATSAALAVVL